MHSRYFLSKQMGQLVRIKSGKWNKSAVGCWQFEGDHAEVEQYIVARTNENIDSFTCLIREELVIGHECPIALTYQMPDRMLHGIPSNSQPANIVTSDDVEFLMSVQEWTNGVQLCNTYGARNVAKYQFLCRTSFNIGDVKYLDGSVTEEEHFAYLRGLVAGDIICCSETLLKHLFSEEKLVLIYRLLYEIEMAKGFPLCETNGLSETVNGEELVNGISTYVTMNFQVTGNENAKVVEVDQSSTGSTGYIRQGVEGDTQYNPIHVTVDEGSKQHDDASKVNERRLSGGVEGVQNNFIHVIDDSDNRPVNIPMGSDRVIINDSSSDIVGYQGINNPDVVFVGMIFKCREDFKQHMAMYAIRNKFRFQNTCSAPGGMVKTVNLAHSCSVDDRVGYQSQTTHTVIGGMMRAKFAGRGGDPRPNEIREAMQVDHDVHISYWKAWRSREVALDYGKGSLGASYNLLPTYLEKLVHANRGSIAEIHTEFTEGIGHSFKYMFLALYASIAGYRFPHA
ncbi:unnamed protein product [Brassica oleracea]